MEIIQNETLWQQTRQWMAREKSTKRGCLRICSGFV